MAILTRFLQDSPDSDPRYLFSYSNTLWLVIFQSIRHSLTRRHSSVERKRTSLSVFLLIVVQTKTVHSFEQRNTTTLVTRFMFFCHIFEDPSSNPTGKPWSTVASMMRSKLSRNSGSFLSLEKELDSSDHLLQEARKRAWGTHIREKCIWHRVRKFRENNRLGGDNFSRCCSD